MKKISSIVFFFCFSFLSFGQNETQNIQPVLENLNKETKPGKEQKAPVKINESASPVKHYRLSPEQKKARRIEEMPVMTKETPISQ